MGSVRIILALMLIAINSGISFASDSTITMSDQSLLQSVSHAIRHVQFDKIGHFGSSDIQLYQAADHCVLFWQGDDPRHHIQAVGLWSSQYPRTIIIFPRKMYFHQVLQLFEQHQALSVQPSHSTLTFNEKTYPLVGIKQQQHYQVLWTRAPQSLTLPFIDGAEFQVDFREPGLSGKSVFGLWGVRDAMFRCRGL